MDNGLCQSYSTVYYRIIIIDVINVMLRAF